MKKLTFPVLLLPVFTGGAFRFTGDHAGIQEEGCRCGQIKILPPGSYRWVGEKRQKCMFDHDAKQYSWYNVNEYCHSDDDRCGR